MKMAGTGRNVTYLDKNEQMRSGMIVKVKKHKEIISKEIMNNDIITIL